MKKVLVSLISAGLLLSAVAVLAQGPVDAPGWAEVDVMATLDNISNWLFAILLAVAVMAIIVAAYMFVTASGDPDKVKTARNFVLYALIGVIVALVARGLVLLMDRIVV